MSDKIEWNVEECIQVIESLNRYGTLIKNSIASIYNTFRYKISSVWSGHNYNVVVREVNGCAPEFRNITTYLGVTVPTVMLEIVNAQAGSGQGYARQIALESNNDNPDIWEIQESAQTSDGSTYINLEALRPYILGAEYPSITAAIELAKSYFNNYLSVFEQNLSIFNNNSAVVNAYQTIQTYKTSFESTTSALVSAIITAAEKGIDKIEETDISTRKKAQDVTGEGESNGTSGSEGSHRGGGGNDSIKRSPEVIHRGAGSNTANPYVSSEGAGSNTANPYRSSQGSGSSSSSPNVSSGGAGSNSASPYVSSGGAGSNSASPYISSGGTNSSTASGSEDTSTYTDKYGNYHFTREGEQYYIDRKGDAYYIDKNGKGHQLSGGTWDDAEEEIKQWK